MAAKTSFNLRAINSNLVPVLLRAQLFEAGELAAFGRKGLKKNVGRA
jgi:hypothetical protein